MKRDAADAGAFFACARGQGVAEKESVEPADGRAGPLRCQRGDSPGGALVVARGGMGGTWRGPIIETASDFCGKSALPLFRALLLR